MTRSTSITARMLLLASTFAIATPAFAAKELPIANRTSFRLGDAGVMCTAQSRATDVRLTGLFDRAYALTCRDASSAVGSLLAVRRAVDPVREPGMIKSGILTCGPASGVAIDGIAQA